MQPYVTAVMITGKHPGRRHLAGLAVESFRRQTYPADRRKLLVINDSGEAWFAGQDDVDERLVGRQPTLGNLRNLALSMVTDGLVIQWDDDDWHGRERIARQVAAWLPGRANILQDEILCDLASKEGKVVSASGWRYGGFPGTILHPVDSQAKYPLQATGEDSEFLRHWQGRLDAIDNSTADYVRFFHGGNTWDRAHFDSISSDSRPLNHYEVKELEHVLWMVDHHQRQTSAKTIADVAEVVGKVRWMDRARAELFCDLLARRVINRRPKILEIGHLHGCSTCYLATIGDVTTIDLPASLTYAPRVEDMLQACKLQARIIRDARGSMHAMFDLIEAGEIYDLIYIDGGHDLENIVQDFAMSTALLQPGGIIAIDDVDNPRYPAVRRFAAQALPRHVSFARLITESNLALLLHA